MSTITIAGPDVRKVLSLRRQVVISGQEWLRRHAASLAILVPVLAAVSVVHTVGSDTFPRYVDDPGTYLSQAWSLRYDGTLSPYSYFYDHAPAGWIQIALWSLLSNGFERHDSAMAFGTECMLLAKVATTALLYGLARRLRFTRAGATGAALLFGLCPLGVIYGRWTFLDNLVVPWLLAAFLLAYSPRRSISAGTGAALCFGMAALTKETALIFLPAFLWAMTQNTDRRNRAQVAVVAAFAGAMLMALYPLFALFKGELLPGEGHNSLLGTAAWQLTGRETTGSLLDADSPMRGLFEDWLAYDQYLVLGGLAAIPIALTARRLRPIALVLIVGWLLTVRDGYVPFMHVITLLPWSALLVAGALERIGGNRGLLRVGPPTLARRRRRAGWLRPAIAVLMAAGVLALTAVHWTPTLHDMMTVRQEPALRSATRWAGAHIPRESVLVVHDTIWVDLVHHYGFSSPRPIIAHKLDNDPAVRENLTRLDYLIVPTWYYATDTTQYPTLVEARRHAVVVATFGEGDDGVRVYRVSRYWEP